MKYLGDVNLIKILLENGANPSAGNQNMDTPLHFAANLGDFLHIYM